ncbi:uncharacterized protein LOC126176518 [Schistocerca cancellata]|uniref:uncharacterized protein LOC126176518 n=1 Tax=Schistocerca cancellata TaxID=274614 RepID=UPI002118D5F9|nr:uncharacterized protein LOC126176518 [Schistocerca cancellata]
MKEEIDLWRQQIDYILVKAHFRNQIKDCRSYPSADLCSDHNLVLMKSSLRFKRVKKKPVKLKWELEKLKTEVLAKRYAHETDNIATIFQRGGVNEDWDQIKSGIYKVAQKIVGRTEPKNKRKWITADIIECIENRRLYKNSTDEQGKAECRRLRNLFNREARKAKENFLEEMCREVEENIQNGRTDLVYRTANQIF